MNGPPASSPEAPGRRISIALAVAVHLGLAIFLIYGVHWQSEHPEAVEVNLVQSVPATPAAEPPSPAPSPTPAPPPPKPVVEPKPEPKPAPPPPKPDIAVKEKPKPPKEEPKPFNPLEAMKNEAAKPAQPSVSAAADKELAQLRADASAAHNKAAAAWSDRIASKIKHNIIRPANAAGNPEAIYEITLLPDGSLVGAPRLKQSTGNAALDAAIERAIRKSDPLPKPEDPSVFQRILLLKFRPLEE